MKARREAHLKAGKVADPGDARPIAVDAASRGAPTGIGLYGEHLLRELSRGPLSARLLPLSPPRGRSHTLWMVGDVPRELTRRRVALFHGLANFDLPLRKPPGTRYVLTVQDLIPLELPEAVSRAYRFQFRVWLWRSLQLADALICTSQVVADALRARFPWAPPVRVVPLGVDHVRRKKIAPAAQRYFLCLGSLEPRKNVLGLARAFAARWPLLGPLGLELWIAGHAAYQARATLRELMDLSAAGVGVRVLGPQARGSLEQLVQGALALCAPSFAEGFGLPPLEALALGTPVLASDIPAHREVLGDAAVFADPADGGALGAALVELATDPGLRADLRSRGPARAAEFTWARAARETEAVYFDLLEGSSLAPAEARSKAERLF